MSKDVIYYNVSIGNNNPNDVQTDTGVGIIADVEANNNIPIIEDPSQYYASIIRFAIPGFNIPLINFLIQTPVTNINLGVYSFTIGDGVVFSDQIFVEYIPQINLPSYQIPVAGTPSQQFGLYYFLYDYTWFIKMLNTSLETATASYNTKKGTSITSPFFIFNAVTQLITLYTDSTDNFDQNEPNPIYIYFNSPLRNYFSGLPYVNTSLAPNGPIPTNIGADNYIVVTNENDINKSTIPYSTTPSKVWLLTSYQYNAYGYWTFLKNILVTTSMNVESEIFYINNSSALQNVQYVNVLTDYQPDFAVPNGAGVSSQILSYNAQSLFRIFAFNQRTPLYKISLTINYVDAFNNVYPLYLDIGQQANFKIMFIKKSLWSPNNSFQN